MGSMISSGSSWYSHILWLSLRSQRVHSPTLPLDSWNPAKHVHWVTSQKKLLYIYIYNIPASSNSGVFWTLRDVVFWLAPFIIHSAPLGRSRYIIQIFLLVFQMHLEIQWTPGIPYSICICLIPTVGPRVLNWWCRIWPWGIDSFWRVLCQYSSRGTPGQYSKWESNMFAC